MPTSVDPKSRPAHLYRNGRPTRPDFDSNETLYRRVHPQHVLDGTVLADAFKFPDLSVMRSSECQGPDDARWVSEEEIPPGEDLVVYDDFYVFGILVRDIPGRVEGETGGKDYDVRLAHKPYDDLFAHSEVQLMKGGTHIQKENKIPSLIKRKIRDHLAKLATELAKPKL